MICPQPVPVGIVTYLNFCLLTVTEESKQIPLFCHRSASFVRKLHLHGPQGWGKDELGFVRS